jgi:crotonyl-CoA carboxylase/reductase
MVVTCGATTGYTGAVDLRYLWMRQKRVQGSHFANAGQCRAFNDLVLAGRIDPACHAPSASRSSASPIS